MMFSRRLLASLAILTFTQPMLVHAQTANEETCRERIVSEMTTAHDTYRSYLFGSQKDRDGGFTVKTGGTANAARKGIFETKKRMTSELITPLLESYRTYRCQNLLICETMQQSFTSPSPLTTQKMVILGCEDRTEPLYPQCWFSNNQNINVGNMITFCTQTMNQTLEFERETLKLAVAYDAGHRAMLQFGGMVDWMIKDMPTRNFLPLRSMVNMLGKLHQIPCFTGQCDMPDTSSLTLP